MKLFLCSIPLYVVLNIFALFSPTDDPDPCDSVATFKELALSKSNNNVERFVMKPMSLILYPGIKFGQHIEQLKYCQGE